jgi:hypothetical protein
VPCKRLSSRTQNNGRKQPYMRLNIKRNGKGWKESIREK